MTHTESGEPLASPDNLTAGQAYELFAACWLQQQGLELLQRNFRTRGGEIDLIMRDGDTLVFVEVRFRSNSRHGDARASITTQKQRRLLRCARSFLLQYERQFRQLPPCRFDVVAINGGSPQRVHWLRNAIHSGM